MSHDCPWKSTWLGAYFPPHPDPPVPSGWARRLRCWSLAEGWHTHIWRCSVVDKTHFSWKGGRGILKPCRSVRMEDRVGWPGCVYGQCREDNYRAEKEDNTKTEGPLGTREGVWNVNMKTILNSAFECPGFSAGSPKPSFLIPYSVALRWGHGKVGCAQVSWLLRETF